MTEATVLWAHDLLWAKSRLYMTRALSVPRDSELYPFWASLTLEFLGRAALAYVHPALLADGTERDGRNVLYAFGHIPKIKNFVPKSIAVTEVYARCEQLMPDFTKELEVFCSGLAITRNEELHTGGSPFAALKPSTWQPRFYASCQVLLAFQGKRLDDLLGKAETEAAEKMMAALADEAAKSVQKSVAAHAAVWKAKDEVERSRLQKDAAKAAVPYLGHVTACPACDSRALVTGEEVSQQPLQMEDDELVERTVLLPSSFRCIACGLTMTGHNQLYAAGLGDTFTNTHRYDPVEFYAPEPDSDSGEDYFNE